MPYQLVRARARDAFDQQHVHRVLEHRTVPLLLDVLEVLGRRATRGVVLAHVTDAARELREALAGGRGAAPFDAQGLGLEELGAGGQERSGENTSELQSLAYIVCRLLLVKKKQSA